MGEVYFNRRSSAQRGSAHVCLLGRRRRARVRWVGVRTVSPSTPGKGLYVSYALQVGMKSKVPPIPKHAEVKADPGVLARFNSSVIEEFRANGGVVGGPFENSAVMLLTMTGAKSGQPRLTPLEYFQVDGRVIFVGTRGGGETNPAWVHNVRANPNVHVEMGAESYDAVARELSGDERDSVYAKVKELCPRILTYPVPARQIPVFELLRVSSLAPPHERLSP